MSSAWRRYNLKEAEMLVAYHGAPARPCPEPERVLATVEALEAMTKERDELQQIRTDMLNRARRAEAEVESLKKNELSDVAVLMKDSELLSAEVKRLENACGPSDSAPCGNCIACLRATVEKMHRLAFPQGGDLRGDPYLDLVK